MTDYNKDDFILRLSDMTEELADADAEIKRLEADVERLKCCGNCKYFSPYYCPLHWSCEPNEYCDKWQSDGMTQEDRK